MKRIVLRLGLLVILTVVVALATSAAPTVRVLNAPRIPVKEGTSLNWAGYAVETNFTNPTNNAVSDAKGTWVVPSVAISGNANTYSSVWVGVDGYSDSTVEQIGTEQDWYNGAPRYYAWFEMYPKMSWMINKPLNPGDKIAAEVKYVNKQFVLTLTDTSVKGSAFNWSFTTTQKMPQAQRQSAEWIVEAPWSGGVLPLANFGTVNFGNAGATLNGVSGTISSWPNDPITMVDGTATATPSGLSSDGSSFSVTWSTYSVDATSQGLLSSVSFYSNPW